MLQGHSRNKTWYKDIVIKDLSGKRPDSSSSKLWCQYEGENGPGKGKHIVLIAGDSEYRSEQTLPMLAKILAVRHGFKCTVLFPIDPSDGTIRPDFKTNIPGIELLDNADLVILGLRFRQLRDEQMEHFVNYVDAGKPVIGIRTSTHAFKYPSSSASKYRHFGYKSKRWAGGFGQQVLGETWAGHQGKHRIQSTRGVTESNKSSLPILNGVSDVWGSSNVYKITHLPLSANVLMKGQVLDGLEPNARSVATATNDDMMPIAWTKNFLSDSGKTSRVFCTTMGAATDFQNEGLRRLLVNASYWCLEMDNLIPRSANVDYVDDYHPEKSGHEGFIKGLRPEDFDLKRSPDTIPDIKSKDWVSLFNGRNLSGWTRKQGTATYRVQDRAIVGRTMQSSANTFLCTDKEYGDFALTFETKRLGRNSGVQIRSLSKPEYKNGKVHGPQIEIEPAPGSSGYLYSCLLYTSPSPRDRTRSRMPSSA